MSLYSTIESLSRSHKNGFTRNYLRLHEGKSGLDLLRELAVLQLYLQSCKSLMFLPCAGSANSPKPVQRVWAWAVHSSQPQAELLASFLPALFLGRCDCGWLKVMARLICHMQPAPESSCTSLLTDSPKVNFSSLGLLKFRDKEREEMQWHEHVTYGQLSSPVRCIYAYSHWRDGNLCLASPMLCY